MLNAWSVTMGANEIEWRIIETQYATDDVVVAGLNVLDFAADSSGLHDSTKAFQEALDRVGDAGGGTVFVPEGKYRFEGSLEIPTSVTLRGEWKKPSKEDPSVGGTVLMPYGGKDRPEGTPFITVGLSAGVKDLNIWYPEQNLRNPIPYPYCLIQKGGNNATFENLTLVNPYQGIKIGPGGNELHLVRNVYGTPIKTGVWYDSTTDIGRLQTISFTPFWWAQSGLPNTPHVFDWIRQNGTAIHMGRSDWEYVADIYLEGYYRGYFMDQGLRGAANAQFYRMIIRNCEIGMEIVRTNPFGMVFTECFFQGSRQGVLIDEPFDSTVMFSNCVLSGAEAIRSDGNGKILMENCQVLNGHLAIEAGAFSALSLNLKNEASRIEFSSLVEGAILDGDEASNWMQLVDGNTEKVQIAEKRSKLKPSSIPEYPKNPQKAFYPARRDWIQVVTPSGNDDTRSIQEAMNRVAGQGGGTVFLPAGDYLLKGQLVVPSGVELRGVHDVPHHTSGGGSVLHVYQSEDTATVRLQEKSGLRGLSFYYPEQFVSDIQPYPFLIQGQGSDIYVINVNAANPYKFIDFMSYRCDHHYIDYASGSPLNVGIVAGGGSVDGLIMNMQFNPHYWGRIPSGRNPLYSNKVEGGVRNGTGNILWEHQKENLDALVIGNTTRQFLFQNFVYGSLYGIRFTQQDGQGAVDCISHGHGTDGSKIGVFFEHGEGTISMINSELVAMSSRDKTAIVLGENFNAEVAMVNTMIWGTPDLLADIRNGALTIQNMHANRHGEGFKLKKGRLLGLNLSFNQSGGRHLSVEPGPRAVFKAVITNGSYFGDSSNSEVQLLIQR
jgi:hypothetical protein